MKKSEAIEVEIEEIRDQFQDFLTEIPKDYLISRAQELERELSAGQQADPGHTKDELNEKYLKLIESVKG